MKDYNPTGTPLAIQTGKIAITTTPAVIFSYVEESRHRITLFDISGDNNMTVYGLFKVKFKDRTITGTPQSPGWIDLLSSLNGFGFDWSTCQIELQRGEKIEIEAQVSTGTANVQVQLAGEQLME